MEKTISIQSGQHLAEMLVKFPKAEIRGAGLVRDKNGRPRIDGDPEALHPSIRAALSDAEFNTAKQEFQNNG